jgi:hypothetical protein
MAQHWTIDSSGWVVPKRDYPTRRKADQAKDRICRRNGWPIGQYRAYRCKDCGRYHFGRVRGRRRFN